MREQGSVAEADERMHDRGRLDRHLYPVVWHAEQIVRLDHLEPLVRERRGVHGDLRAHAPGRMRERLLGRDVLELGARAAAERAAGTGEDERVDLLRLAPLEALEERRVLAVDRQDPAAAPLPRGEGELAGGDEALLVREREVDAALERPERRVHSGEADDGVEDDVRLRALEQLGQVASDLLQRRVDVVERRRAGGRGAELELRDAPRRSRSPGGRSSRSPRAARRVSPAKCTKSAPSGIRRRRRGSRRPARRRAGRRSGRACRRGRPAAFPCPSPRGRASSPTRRGRR